MCSSSTASTTAPLACARSVSRIRAACISAAVAAWSDAPSCPEIWRRTATKSPPPSSASINVRTPAYQSVRSSRSRASGLTGRASRAEAVARAAQRRDQLGLEAVVDLAAQSRHEHLQHVDERIVVVVPHVRRDRGAVEQASLVQHEQLEQGELLRGEGDRPAAAAYLAGGDVHLEVRHAIERRRERGAAARQRLEPRQELAEGEGLRQVVVGAGLEPAHPVVQGIERRQHQDRRGGAAAAQLAAQVEAGAAGEADVQDDDVVAAERCLLQAVREGGRERRIDALRAQAVAQEARQLGIVFYDQYPHSSSGAGTTEDREGDPRRARARALPHARGRLTIQLTP